MSNLLEYKGYQGTVEFSAPDNVLHGSVIGIRGLISYEGTCINSLRKDFEEAIDFYLEMCEKENMEIQKPYKGKFNVRISPELHKNLVYRAAAKGQSLNSTVEEAIRQYIED